MSSIFAPQKKILCHLQKVEDLIQNKNPHPILIEIDPSNACNHSCPFCISGHLHLSKFKNTELFNRKILDKKIFQNLINDLVKMNIEAINWTGGGEPTMNPFLNQAINFIKNNSKIQMGMFSNGTLLKKFNLIETIVKSLEWIRISIDAGKEETYNNLRVTNSSNNFNVVLNNIIELINLKKKFKSSITIGVGYVITKENFQEIIDFANIFKNIDVDYCQFKPEIIQIERSSNGKSIKQIEASFWALEVLSKLNEAKNILGGKFECNEYKVEDLIKDPKNYGRSYKKCLGSQLQPCIGADGNVYVCTNHRGHKKYSYGNLYERSFEEIWNDLKKKTQIMNVINFDEKFKNCTNLCKPHESNKLLDIMTDEFSSNKHYFDNLKKESDKIKNSIKHKNFI